MLAGLIAHEPKIFSTLDNLVTTLELGRGLMFVR